MRRTTALVSVVVARVVLLLGPAATAGGWWSGIDLQGRYLGIGETMTVRSEVMFRTMHLAKEARTTDYHAYLLRGVDRQELGRAMSRPEPKRWWTPPEEMTQIGDVQLSRWNSNLAIATARLTIPGMSPGRYDLMLCDDGCRTPLGNLIPLQVQVTEAFAAQTARKLEKTNAKLDSALARLRTELRQRNRQIDLVEEASAESANAIGRLRENTSPLDTDVSDPWPAFAGWFLAGAATALVAMRVRRREYPRTPRGPSGRVPDDAGELLRTG